MGREDSPKIVRAAEMVAQAVRLRRNGWTYDEIAETCGYANAGVAHNAVTERMRSLRKETSEDAALLLQVEVDRLEGLWRTVSDKIEDGHTDPATIAAALRVCERKAKLLGLDKPTKHEYDVQFGMSRVEADNSSDHRVAVILLQKCAIMLGEDPLEIAKEAILGLNQDGESRALLTVGETVAEETE